jgi:hypothetical protein
MATHAKNPVMLVLVGLPLATLVAGVATLVVIGRGGLDAVGDPVRRTAQVQQVDLRADEAARQLDLRGRVARVGDATWLELDGVDGVDGAIPLRLHLEHPLDAAQDRVLDLQPTNNRWKAAPFDAGIGWRVSVESRDGAWRLVARWPRHARDVLLLPAIAQGDIAPESVARGPG